MELYIGGLSQGKLEYVLTKYNMTEDSCNLCDGSVCTKEEILKKKVINHYHEFIRSLLGQGENTEDFTKELTRINPDAIIICNEVGNGVVPMEKEERLFREAVGHCTQIIAAKSQRVERVICGIGIVLKS